MQEIRFTDGVWFCPNCQKRHDRPRGRSWDKETKISKCICGAKYKITTIGERRTYMETIITDVEAI